MGKLNRKRRRELARQSGPEELSLTGKRVSPLAHVPSKALRGDVAILNMLTAIKQQSKDLELQLGREVRRARRAGVSWARIGEALGVTDDACRLRWGPYPVDAPRVPRRKVERPQSTPTG